MNNLERPSKENYTIYSKSGCINCKKVKDLLKEYQIEYIVINCDEYLIENKEDFLKQMAEEIGHEYKTFPMVFNNRIFVGGYNETLEKINKENIKIVDDF